MVRTNDPEIVWDKPNEVEDKWTQFIDENVLRKLPKGSKPLGMIPIPIGNAALAAHTGPTVQVTLTEAMVTMEIFPQSTLYAAVPDFTSKPYEWGTYAADPNIHFFLCEVVNMDEVTLPDPQRFARGLAKVHRTAVSPSGKYGFPVATLQGLVPQFAAWTDTWEEFFRRSFRRLVENEEKVQGQDAEMRKLEETIFGKVIP
ncbi:hypothetical protein BDR22DRAFT_891911 [Usnea florida]